MKAWTPLRPIWAGRGSHDKPHWCAGYRGIGEVVEARDNGMLGKSGKLNVRLSYLKVGDQRPKLRANKGAKGDVFWPAAPFIKGKDVSLKKGSLMTAFADQDVELPSPLAAPPAELN